MPFNPIDVFLHIDRYLAIVVGYFGHWSYFVLGFVIFMETGFVFMPFLPGDSLLFTAGAFMASGILSPIWTVPVMILGAILGDAINYIMGRWFSDHFLAGQPIRFVKKAHLEKTQAFYDKHGSRMIVLARFVPIVRTVAPFLAGLMEMNPRVFFSYNVFGGVLWASLFLAAGYFFGNIPAVKERFSLVVMGVVALSVSPLIFEALSAKWLKRADKLKRM